MSTATANHALSHNSATESLLDLIRKLNANDLEQLKMLWQIYRNYGAPKLMQKIHISETSTLAMALAEVYRCVSRKTPAAYELVTEATGLPVGLHVPMRAALAKNATLLSTLREGNLSKNICAAVRRVLADPTQADDATLDAIFQHFVATVGRKRAMSRRRTTPAKRRRDDDEEADNEA